MEITFGRRNAQGLTFSVVIQTRVMQPGGSTRGEQKWRIALCGYGLTFKQRQRVHWSGFIQSHLRRGALCMDRDTMLELLHKDASLFYKRQASNPTMSRQPL